MARAARQEKERREDAAPARRSFRRLLVKLAETQAREEQLQVQLAGCSVAAMGWSKGKNVVKRGQYGWSVPYADVMKLRNEVERLRKTLTSKLYVRTTLL